MTRLPSAPKTAARARRAPFRGRMLLAYVLAAGCVGDVQEVEPASGPAAPGGRPASSAPAGRAPGTPNGAAPGGPPSTGAPAGPGPAAEGLALPGGARPLSPDEYEATLRALFGDLGIAAADQLPEPAASRELAFENDAPSKAPSSVLVDALERVAWEVAAAVVARPAALARVLPCTPKGPDDAACFEAFVKALGRRALRRPLDADEVAGYARLRSFSVEAKRFEEGVRLVIAALLQQPDFYNRVEAGRPVPEMPGVLRLDGFERATKLSYLLLGTTPDDRLLDRAAAGALDGAEGMAAAARDLLADPRARARVFTFHAEWLGFSRAQTAPDLVEAMTAEARALVEDVIFTRKASHHDLWLADRTFIDDRLARHYGLPAPGKATWVPVGGGTGRRGLLSQAAFLSAAAKPEDTSPVNRGLLVAGRLLCRHVPDPPPDLDTTLPTDTTCRREMFEKHLTRGASCAACHAAIDPIGFGLESYDRTGKHRTTELDRPSCPIDGQGEVPGLGAFRGPAELAALLVTAPELDHCLVEHLHQFAVGRAPGGEDKAVIDRLTESFVAGGRSFLDLLVAMAADPSFVHRRAP